MNREIAVPAGRATPFTVAAAAPLLRRWGPWLSLVAVTGLALALDAWQLADNGYGNTYYAAAVRSMSGSWHNFFFASFDPGGFITVDKPPVFLWVGALSARVFGYSSWSILLPSAVAGAGATALLWYTVRRYFGLAAATVAGATFALTPITVAVDRLNLPEPFFILALVGAVAAVVRSLEGGRWWVWTLLAGALVGVAFNTKMMAGWIPGPALALALVVGDGNSWRPHLRRMLGRLVLLAAATFAVSASWMLVVDAWPADSRPYIGGSKDNSVANLVFDYNGFGRVEGNQGPGGARPPGANGVRPGDGAPAAAPGALPRQAPGGAAPGTTPGQVPQTNGVAPNGGIPGPQGPGAAGARGQGGIIAGSPGPWRMFDDANGPQIAWLLPFALMGAILGAWHWHRDRVRRAAVVAWLGWTLLFGLVFSFAEGIYHSYYTSALAPGIAALSGIAVAAGIPLLRRHLAWGLPLAAAAAVTGWLQFDLAGRFPGFQDGLRPLAPVVVVAGLALAGLGALAKRPLLAPGLLLSVSGLLLLPASWTWYEVTRSSMNTTLPQAGPRQGAAGRSFGSQPFDTGADSLATWLAAHGEAGARWQLAVASAQNASRMIAAGRISVMALGGFSGGDPAITVAGFASLVERGEVRYVLAGGGIGPGFGPGPDGRLPGAPPGADGTAPGPARGQGALPGRTDGLPGGTRALPPAAGAASAASAAGAQAVIAAARAACTAVTANDLPAQYQGQLYDCRGAAATLRRLG